VECSECWLSPSYCLDNIELLQQAIKQGEEGKREGQGAAGGVDPDRATEEILQAKKKKSEARKGPYKHLMNGVSYMIPIIVAGGLLLAIAFAIEAVNEEAAIISALIDIGGEAAFLLIVPVLAGFISYSIADKPGLAPGLIGGLLASQLDAGFLGGIVAGFLAGYITLWLKNVIKLPRNLEGIKPILLLPFLSTLAVGLLMYYVIGAPVAAVMGALEGWLAQLSGANAALLGLIMGAMMAVDMGGPVNKAAYTVAVGLLTTADNAGPMAAVMAAGMTPPLGLWLATMLAPKKYTTEEREAGKAAGVLGISFITEGAIPFAAADPLRVIPSIIVGSAVAGSLSMMFGATSLAPHGGIFVIPFVTGIPLYILSIAIGMVVTALLVNALKRNVTA
jgi:fructose PTS system EIIBC or EIIC component